ncbi:MAG: 16S rRNA (guanine(527)-N(7))-methyltransferase RsmG [Halioglobus sp.]
MEAQLRTLLLQGCDSLKLDLTDEQITLLLDYLELLVKWNKAYNLTSVRDPVQMVIRHLLDSLAIVKYCNSSRCIDVGTGAGLPGVPLAIVYPDREFLLLDSNGKKTRFLFQVKTALGLDNINIHHGRVESYQGEQLFEEVFSRAFSSLRDMVAGCQHLLSDGGVFKAMKGAYPDQELTAIESVATVKAVHSVIVPGLNEQRHLIELTPV